MTEGIVVIFQDPVQHISNYTEIAVDEFFPKSF